MPTLRIPVSDDLHYQLTELKGKMKADDWPTLMECLVIESRWADFARPLVNTLLEWAQAIPPKEPELLKKLGFVFMENIDGEGHTGILFPSPIDGLLSISQAPIPSSPGYIPPSKRETTTKSYKELKRGEHFDKMGRYHKL